MRSTDVRMADMNTGPIQIGACTVERSYTLEVDLRNSVECALEVQSPCTMNQASATELSFACRTQGTCVLDPDTCACEGTTALREGSEATVTFGFSGSGSFRLDRGGLGTCDYSLTTL
ncbi:MAG: hypothetical protein AAF938_08200 [Myxococcota bacterium]